ncbi:hypothetical protein HXX76_000894 [Chlamydomonas incerta]|uniref:Right handed beta helix domain-containing protein n=1 Tax=Chlamydomonas incerta TaxID=51695 RepID=A0A835WF82_CHLIN|nr:hypothetical protein HXX76_000894 [Chlamydomonas incerta]|eukprot:KAG2446306.1 hypothetical protein HXX76_000894 [Chlamydomonas incerta]
MHLPPASTWMRGFDPVWFYYGGDTVDVVYRIVYRYANGAHSCPAPLTLRTSSEDYKYSMVAWSMDRTASPPGKRTIMVQRKGHIGKLYGVGPAWLTDLWIDVTDTVDDGSSDVVSAMDRTNGYDPTTGELDVAGPAVAGWRWKHGSVGLTSLYVPETFPELTATNGAGINATYQLVYELWTTQATTDFLAYSYPGPLRFTVHHPRSSTPLLIYVQLESVVHPANLAALLLQRVEGDSVWTVARLPPESNEIKLQQQMLLFRDETNIQGWGCPPSVAPPAGLGSPDASKDAMNSSGQTMGKVAAEDRSAAGTNSSSKPPPQQTVGAMLVTGARDVRLEGFSCQHVTGATAWSCLAVEYAAVEDLMVKPTAPIYSLIMEDTHVLENSVSPAVEAGMAALAQGQVDTVVRALLNMTSLNGAGAVVLLAHNATTTAANTSTTVDIHIQQSDLSYNTGGAGSVLFLGPGLEGDMVLARTSINHNNASGNGGAICTMGFLQSLKLTRGSSFDGNSAAAQGGAVYAPLGYGLFSLDSSSASGNQASEGGIMASGLNAGNVTITNGSRMDHNMAAQACPLLSAWVQSADLPPADYGGANVTIRASSVSHNNGGLRAFTFFILRSLTVTDAIIEGGSVSLTHVGWYPVPSFDRDLYFIHIERSHFINAVNLYTGFITWCAANVHELRILDSVIERNSVLASGVLGSGYLFSNVLIRNTSISHNMINRTDASYGAVLASFASAGNVTFEDVVIRNNTGGRYGGFNVAQLGSLTISGPRTVMEGFVNGFFIVDESAGAITISDGALIRDNVDLSGARSGGFIQIAKNAGDITIDNATLLNGMAGINGGFIYVANDVVGSIRMSNARVEGHSAANGAGGLIAVGGNVQGVVEITNSRICGCQAKTSGGALYIQSGVFGGIFLAGANTSLCGNRALTGSGGAIAGGFTVPVAAVSDGAQLLDNKAEVDGGAVWASGLLGNVTISRGARVARNSAAENGGAFAAGFIAGLELRDGGEAIGNAAGVDGGLVWADRLTSVWIRGASATSNSAGNSGGVLAVNTLPDLVEMDGAVLSENRAKQGGGGAISVRVPVPGSALLSQVSPSGQALFSITGGSALSGNYAYMDGGVISIIAEQRGNAIDAVSNAPQIQLSVRMETSDFRANKAGGAGGAVFVSAPALGAVRVAITALQCRFTRNTAGSSVFERGSTIDSGYGGAVAATSTPKYRAMAMLESAEQQQQWAYGTSSSGSSSRGAAALAYLDSACSLLLQGCGFEDNTALGNGGAVSVVSCPTRVTQSSFTRNTAQFSGGGLSSQVESLDIASVLGAAQRQQQERRRLQQQPQPLPLKPSESNPWLQVHDSNFSNNTAIGACGGGLHVEFGRGEGASVARCQFSRNTAASASGGAMCLQARGSSGRAAVADCSFRGNSAAELGGGVLAELGGGGGGHRLLLSRLTMQSDAAGRAGGAVALTSISAASALTLRDSSISNSSSLQGGAIYAQCSATPNSAAASGGEGALASATAGSCSSGGGDVLSIYNSTISRCLARGSGGGLYLAAGTTATVQNCTFTANTAVLSGGAVRGSECARLSLERVAVQGGSAGQLGGGVASTCAVLLLNGSSITSNSALTGGGLALSGPGVAAGSAEQQTAARSTATIINVRLASNSAGSSSSSSSSSSSGGSSTATGSSGSSTQQAAAYP